MQDQLTASNKWRRNAIHKCGLTARASAALLRSRTPSGAASTKFTNFLVSNPRELSYRQFPASSVSKICNHFAQTKAVVPTILSDMSCLYAVRTMLHLCSPLPLPGVPGDRVVCLMARVDFRFLTSESAIEALLCLKKPYAKREEHATALRATLATAYTCLGGCWTPTAESHATVCTDKSSALISCDNQGCMESNKTLKSVLAKRLW